MSVSEGMAGRMRSLAQHRQDHLIVLAARLSEQNLIVVLGAGKVLVRHPAHEDVADTITCQPRAEDDMALWFYTSWREPIAGAEQVTEAVAKVVAYMVVKP